MHNVWILIATLLVVGVVGVEAQTLPGGANLESSGGVPPLPLRVGLQIRSDMKPGEVLARGNRVDLNNDGVAQENECYFDYGLDLRPGQSVDTRVGPGCTIILDSVTERAAVLPTQVPSLARKLFNRFFETVFPSVRAQSYPYQRGVYGHVYMWGLGGKEFDGLTAQQGWYEWEYNYSTARNLHAGGWYCTAGYTYPPEGCLQLLGIPPMNKNNTGWTPLQMGWLDWFLGPGTYTGRLDWSEYWFSSGQQWRHKLYVRRVGQHNGNASCPIWVEGSIVAGATQACYYYNLPWPYGYRP